MNKKSFTLSLSPNEEKVAQLLTRDAWVYFSSMISQRDLFHVKEIPMMPRRGVMEIDNDAELIQYYVDHAHGYSEELALLGWDAEESLWAADSFVAKMEAETGILRGTQLVKFGS
jgi:hypothetical protein